MICYRASSSSPSKTLATVTVLAAVTSLLLAGHGGGNTFAHAQQLLFADDDDGAGAGQQQQQPGTTALAHQQGPDEKQFAMDYTTAKKSAACLLEIRDNYLKLEPYQHSHVAEYFPQYLEKYECVQQLARTTGMDRRGKGILFEIGKRLGLNRWARPGNRLRGWVQSRFGSPARQNDFTCGDLPAAECVAAGFMYRCLGCCLGSEQSALRSGCCNVCLFKVLLFGDDPTLGSIPVEIIEQKYGVAENGRPADGSKEAGKTTNTTRTDAAAASSVPATHHQHHHQLQHPSSTTGSNIKISHTEAALAANDLMLNLDGEPLTPEQIRALEEKKRREQAELEQVSNIAKFLKDNYQPEYLPDVQENDPSTKHTRFNVKLAAAAASRNKKELATKARGVAKDARKVYVWNGHGFDAAIVEENGQITDYGKIIDEETGQKKTSDGQQASPGIAQQRSAPSDYDDSAVAAAEYPSPSFSRRSPATDPVVAAWRATPPHDDDDGGSVPFFGYDAMTPAIIAAATAARPQQRSIAHLSDRNDPATVVPWEGNGKLSIPGGGRKKSDYVFDGVHAAAVAASSNSPRVVPWVGNGKFTQGGYEVNPVAERGNYRRIRYNR